MSYFCYFTKQFKKEDVETLVWLRNNQEYPEGFSKVPVRISIRGFLFKKIVVHYELLTDSQITAYKELSSHKREILQEHLDELEMIDKQRLRNAYIDEIEDLQRLKFEQELDDKPINQKQTIDTSSYEHFKNDLFNQAKEHISKINQLLS